MKQATAHPSCSRTFSSASGLVQTALFNLDDPALCPHLAVLTEAVDHMASHADAESRGAVYTRAEVVDFILDLVGYTADKPLAKTSLLEPSCGEGDFLLPAIGRLLESWSRNGVEGASVVESLRHAICAVELNKEAFSSTAISNPSVPAASVARSGARRISVPDCGPAAGSAPDGFLQSCRRTPTA